MWLGIREEVRKVQKRGTAQLMLIAAAFVSLLTLCLFITFFFLHVFLLNPQDVLALEYQFISQSQPMLQYL